MTAVGVLRIKFADYWLVILAGALLFAPSIFLFPLIYDNLPTQFPLIYGEPATEFCSKTLLCSAGVSPWGAFTSLFIYDSWVNILSYGFFAFLFAFSQFLLIEKERKRRQLFLVISMYVIPIVINFSLVIFVPSYGSYGPSGAVFTEMGMVAGFSLFNSINRDFGSKKYLLLSDNRYKSLFARLNLVVFGVLFLFMVVDPKLFFVEEQGVNFLAHVIGFSTGLLLGYFLCIFGSRNTLLNPV